jgi:hypothetical protein
MRNRVVVGGVQIVIGIFGTARKMVRYLSVFVTATLPQALLIDCSRERFVLADATPADSTLTQPFTTSTPIEKALDELRVRFPKDIVIGFEELFDPRPDREPQVDLGPPGLSLDQVLNHVRSIDPKYHVERLQGRLVHVYPARETADPVGLLDVRLRRFSMPQDSCLRQAIENIDVWFHGYAPELTTLLAERKRAWYRNHGQEVPGQVGDILGNCFSLRAPGPVHPSITVRDALNLMAERSLQVSRGEVTPNDPIYPPYRPASWKFRFRREPDAATGLGGIPLFQTF